MCGNPPMASTHLHKPLNPKAQPWLPNVVYHKTQPVIQLLPAERWPVAPSLLYYNKPYLNCYQGVDFYNVQHQPQYYHSHPHCFPLVLACGGGCGAEGTGINGVVDRKVMGLERKATSVKRVAPPRLRSQRRPSLCFRGGRSYRGTDRCMWLPKKVKSDEAGVLSSPPPSNPPPPPSPTPPPKDSSVPLSGMTTVMIRNIPNQYRRNMLMDFLDNICQEMNHKAKLLSPPQLRFEYDFLYLPMDFGSGDNYGYAFVNFTSSLAAARIRERLQNYKWEVFLDSFGVRRESKKICVVSWARIQGEEALLKRFRNSNFTCQRVDYLPVVLSPPRDGTNSSTSQQTSVGRCLAAPFSPTLR